MGRAASARTAARRKVASPRRRVHRSRANAAQPCRLSPAPACGPDNRRRSGPDSGRRSTARDAGIRASASGKRAGGPCRFFGPRGRLRGPTGRSRADSLGAARSGTQQCARVASGRSVRAPCLCLVARGDMARSHRPAARKPGTHRYPAAHRQEPGHGYHGPTSAKPNSPRCATPATRLNSFWRWSAIAPGRAFFGWTAIAWPPRRSASWAHATTAVWLLSSTVSPR